MKCHRQYIEGGKVDKAGKKGREDKNKKTNKQTNKQTKNPEEKDYIEAINKGRE